MTTIDKIKDMHLAVTDNVYHYHAWRQTDRYFVWQEREPDDLIADGVHVERAVQGITDYFTKMEYDPHIDEFEVSMNETPGVAWYRNSEQYEEETGFIHIEWYWSVVQSG